MKTVALRLTRLSLVAWLLTVLLLISLVVSNQAYSEETRYIRDMLYVPLRSGPGNQYRILHRGLPSGTPLTVIQTNADGQYTEVRMTNGTVGWLQTQYLMEQPATREQVESLEAELVVMQNENDELQQRLHEYETASPMVRMEQENEALRHENQVLKNEVDVLFTDNQRLADKRNTEFFFNGAFAVLIGAAIALVVARLWPKKKETW